uniref:Uncharacterized protein n=1 Tax=Anguilla anguilla TaxID=7936 RepID=A0A0E9R9Z2_ANGAN
MEKGLCLHTLHLETSNKFTPPRLFLSRTPTRDHQRLLPAC